MTKSTRDNFAAVFVFFRHLMRPRLKQLLALVLCGMSIPTIAYSALIGSHFVYSGGEGYASSPIDEILIDFDYDLLEASDVPTGTRSLKVSIRHSFLHAMHYYFVDYGFGTGNFSFHNLSKSELRLDGRRLVGMQGEMDLSGFVSEDEPHYVASDPQFFDYEHILTRGQTRKFLKDPTLLTVREYNHLAGLFTNRYSDGDYEFWLGWELSVYIEFYDDPAPIGTNASQTLALFGMGLVGMLSLRRHSKRVR